MRGRAGWSVMWLALTWPWTGRAQSLDDAYFAEGDGESALEGHRPGQHRLSAPIELAEGVVRFVYGAEVPTVVCAPLLLCDIELEPGESIRDLHIGDQARWSLEAAGTGAPPNTVEHVIVRPVDVGLRTSLVITTDRRTYRLRLRSDRQEHMASVSFAYLQAPRALWPRSKPAELTEQTRSAAAPGLAGPLSALSFAYEIEGDDPPWKPVRVYNDGLQTVIEFPFAMRQSEAPALLVVRNEGGPFSDDEVVQVNFRAVGQRYLVDTVFDVADLVTGVGSSQQRVRIRRTK